MCSAEELIQKEGTLSNGLTAVEIAKRRGLTIGAKSSCTISHRVVFEYMSLCRSIFELETRRRQRGAVFIDDRRPWPIISRQKHALGFSLSPTGQTGSTHLDYCALHLREAPYRCERALASFVTHRNRCCPH